MKPWKAESYLLLVTLIWGGTFTFTKFGLDYCPPFLYITIRFTIAVLITYIFFGKYIRKIDKTTFVHGVVLGLLFGTGFVLQTYGLKLTTVNKSAFITGVTVAIVPFVFWLVERRRIQLWAKIGVIIATFGLWLFTNPDFDNLNTGDVLTLISTFFWAFYITYMDVFTRGREGFAHTIRLVFIQLAAALFVSVIAFAVFESGSFTIDISPTLIISLSYNGIIASFILTLIHTSVQRFSTPVKAAIIFSLEPVFASIIAVVVIHEVLSGRELTGGAILLLGVITSEIGGLVFGKQNVQQSDSSG